MWLMSRDEPGMSCLLPQAIVEFMLTGYPLAVRLSNGELLLDPDNPPPTSPGSTGRRLTSSGAGQLADQGLRGSRTLLQFTAPGALDGGRAKDSYE